MPNSCNSCNSCSARLTSHPLRERGMGARPSGGSSPPRGSGVRVWRRGSSYKEHRHYIGFELNAEYYEKAMKRIKSVTIYDLAANDGLSTNDWLDWFKNYDLTKPMAIIHFTKFRYHI